MIRAFLGLLGALWLTSCGALDGRDWGEPSPALWEATGPEGETLWLFGTIHALPDGVQWRTPALEEVMAQADVLMVEIADLETPALQATFKRLSETPGQPPLTSRVPEADRPGVRRLMANARAESGDFASVETWGAALMLASSVRESDPSNGVDRALISEAEAVIGLETIAGQLGIFDTLPEADQVDFLVLTARSSASNDGVAAMQAWFSGDTQTLRALAAAPLEAYPTLYAALLADRNAAWIPAIEAQVSNGSKPLVAVGAAHMLGPDGLPALLEARGYSLTRLQ